MWLVTTLIALILAIVAFVITHGKPESKKHHLGTLSLMLLGAFVMILVDHLIAFMEEGGPFIEIQTEGLIPNATILGLLMLVPITIAWISIILTKRIQKTRISNTNPATP